MVTSVLSITCAVPSTLPCLPPLPWATNPLPFSRSLSVSPSLTPSFRQLGHLGLLERVSSWWNRGRQLFFQPQGHYLKSDKDSSEWTQDSWGRREKWESGKAGRRRRRGWCEVVVSVVQVYCPVEGEGAGRQMNPAGIWYTPEIAYRSRSQYSGWPERGWEFSEGVNNLAAQLSCPIHQRQRPNQGWIPFSVWGGGRCPPPSLSASLCLSLSASLPLHTAPHFHSIGALKVIEMTAYRKRLIKLFIISLNQYVWIVKTSKSAPGKVIVHGQQQLLSHAGALGASLHLKRLSLLLKSWWPSEVSWLKGMYTSVVLNKTLKTSLQLYQHHLGLTDKQSINEINEPPWYWDKAHCSPIVLLAIFWTSGHWFP